MQERYIAPGIMLVAGAITSVITIINQVEFFESLKRLLIVLILFYIIGKIATKIIIKFTVVEKKSEQSEEDIQVDESQVLEEVETNKE